MALLCSDLQVACGADRHVEIESQRRAAAGATGPLAPQGTRDLKSWGAAWYSNINSK